MSTDSNSLFDPNMISICLEIVDKVVAREALENDEIYIPRGGSHPHPDKTTDYIYEGPYMDARSKERHLTMLIDLINKLNYRDALTNVMVVIAEGDKLVSHGSEQMVSSLKQSNFNLIFTPCVRDKKISVTLPLLKPISQRTLKSMKTRNMNDVIVDFKHMSTCFTFQNQFSRRVKGAESIQRERTDDWSPLLPYRSLYSNDSKSTYKNVENQRNFFTSVRQKLFHQISYFQAHVNRVEQTVKDDSMISLYENKLMDLGERDSIYEVINVGDDDEIDDIYFHDDRYQSIMMRDDVETKAKPKLSPRKSAIRKRKIDVGETESYYYSDEELIEAPPTYLSRSPIQTRRQSQYENTFMTPITPQTLPILGYSPTMIRPRRRATAKIERNEMINRILSEYGNAPALVDILSQQEESNITGRNGREQNKRQRRSSVLPNEQLRKK